MRAKKRKAKLTEKYKRQTERAASDTMMGIVGMAAGDGSPVAREHDRFLYRKR